MTSHVLAAVAWPYANGPRHIGHVSGFGVPSDVFSRYQRMAGKNVLMVSGTDEHGTAIQVQADKEGLTPRQTADKYHGVIARDLQNLGLTYDLYTRTTTKNHAAVVQELFRALHANGYIVAKTQLGAMSPSTGRTLPDRYIEGTCPHCGYDGARGDQCDNCGRQLDPIELKNPRSRINGETPQFIETEHLFLDLPALSEALGSWLETRHDWRPNVLKYSANLISELRARPVTRDLDWGIPIPVDGWKDQSMKRIYVWFDAVVGYLSASIEWARRSGNPEAWREWWTNPDAASYYFMGKDNITFHSVIWPAMLLGANGQGSRGGTPSAFGTLQLPTEIVSSEYLTHVRLEVLDLAQHGAVRGGLPRRVRTRRAALLHLRRGSREPGRGLHVGRVRTSHQHRARQRVGQPRQPLDLHGAQERGHDPDGRARSRTPTRRCSRPRPARSRRSAPSSSAAGSRRRSRSRCGS
jgi:methionyl-tRNA synthetase